MKTLWLNGDKKTKQEGLSHMAGRKADFRQFMKAKDDDNVPELGSFCEYGLCVDYVAPGTWDEQNEGYLRYQISCGGPSEEIRFYYSPGGRKPYRIEFVYLQWGVGVSFDVTQEDWAQWLAQWFDDTETVKYKMQEACQD